MKEEVEVSRLRVLAVLSESTAAKSVTLLLTSLPASECISDTEDLSTSSKILRFCTRYLPSSSVFSLLTAEKSVYTESDYAQLVASPGLPTTATVAVNDIYQRFLAQLPSHHKLSFIHPCTLTHIRKYLNVPIVKITETPTMFKSQVSPYIDSIPPARTEWIRKILRRESEAEDILLFRENTSEDAQDGFVILPDSKWDQATISSLYLLVIAFDSRIRCLRDLDGGIHLNFLKSLRSSVEDVTFKKFGVPANSLRMFVHYQPSYYQFHVHVVNAQMEPMQGMIAGQAHLLDDVIDNLEIDAKYYSKRTISYYLPETHEIVTVLGQRKDNEHDEKVHW
ncbi:hypothetical protein HDU84_006792 [Entophlyctis sp. JEL0112]|nr:hypothetical protein HDU84_006792 [Entophlyctis sp. JEL0112]